MLGSVDCVRGSTEIPPVGAPRLAIGTTGGNVGRYVDGAIEKKMGGGLESVNGEAIWSAFLFAAMPAGG